MRVIIGFHVSDALDPSLVIDESNRERHMRVLHPERELLRLIITEQHTTVRIKALSMHQTNLLLFWRRGELRGNGVTTNPQGPRLGSLQEHLSHCLTYQLDHTPMYGSADLHTTNSERKLESPVVSLDELEDRVLTVHGLLHESIAVGSEPGTTGVEVGFDPCLLVAAVLR